MLSKASLRWFYGAGLGFIALTVLGLLAGFPLVYILPLALLLALLAIVSSDKLLYLTAFLVPLSVTVHDLGMGAGMNLPTEPLVIGLMLIAIFKFALEGFKDQAFLKHPLTLLILFNTAWILLTTFTSTMPLVSLKFFIARTWYIIVFYFFASRLFQSLDNIKRFWSILLYSAAAVVLFVVARHSTFGFTRDSVTTVIQPFFWIHGVYAAMVAYFMPIMLVFFIEGKALSFSPLRRSFFLFFSALFAFAVVYSYTRAAWLSILAAMAALVVILIRVKPVWIYSVSIVAVLGLSYYQGDILMKLSRNKTGSNSKNMEKHLQSATNIKNDPSNLERLNRWSCAYRMYQDKPILGFGPGTYMFQYAPYQLSYQKTVISTNFGTLGHAHSEFLGPLAEGGFIGMLSWLLIFIYACIRALWLSYYAKSREVRAIAMALLLGFLTYFVHGFLNSYFDYDKIAVPFWATLSILVVLDTKEKRELQQ